MCHHHRPIELAIHIAMMACCYVDGIHGLCPVMPPVVPGPPGPSVAIFIATGGPPRQSMAAIDGLPGPSVPP